MCNDPRCRLPGFIPCPPEDVELTVLREKVTTLDAEAAVIKQAADRLWPAIDALYKAPLGPGETKDTRYEACCGLMGSSGWEALVTLGNDKLDEADEIAKRMLEIPAASAVGRQAKLAAFYRHIAFVGDEWHGPIEGADWEIARRLLDEFARMPTS